MTLAFAASGTGQNGRVVVRRPIIQPHRVVAIPPEQHPWGRFPIGSWKTVRVNSETLDSEGRVSNVTWTDTKTTLIAADATSYTLQVEVTVEIAGKRFSKLPETFKHGYQGEKPGQLVAVKHVGNAQIAINGQAIPCEVRQSTIEIGGLKRVSNVQYCSTVWPYQMKRETTIEGAADDQRATTVAEVVALGVQEQIAGEVQSATHVKTTHNQPSGTKVTLEVHTLAVPGGVVSHVATETDAEGNPVRRSTLELVAFGVTNERSMEMAGRAGRKARKAARRMEAR